VFSDRENKTALVIVIVIPLTHNLSSTDAGKSNKDENVALEIKNVLQLHNAPIYAVVTTAEGVVKRNFLNSREYRFNQKCLRSGKNSSAITKVPYSTQIPKDRVFDNCVGVLVICVLVFIVFL